MAEQDPHGQLERTDELRKFELNLYMVIVDSNIYYYVYCGYDAIMRERATLQETGENHRVQFIKLELIDFDVINHAHFC